MNRVRKSVLAVASAFALGIVGLVGALGASPAHAASLVDPLNLKLSITQPGGQPADQLAQFTPFELNASFGLPNSVAPGDQFTIAFPAQVEAYTPAPDISITAPNGAEIGTCVIAKTSVTCTLGSWVLGKDNFTDFHIFIGMYAEETTGNSTLPFTVNGKTSVDVDLPGGSIRPVSPTPFPDGVTKEGWLYRDDPGQVTWRVWFDVRGKSTLTVDDTFGDGMTLVAGSQWAAYWTVQPEEWNGDDTMTPGKTGPTSLSGTFTPKADGKGITFTATVPADATAVAITYRTQLPPGVQFGDVMHNSVDGSLGKADAKVVYQYRASARGNGNSLPDLRIEKKVTGTLPSNATFTVSVSCTKDGVALSGSPYQRTISVDEPAFVLDLPVGSKCAVTETNNGGATAVTYSPANGEVTIDGTTDLVTVVVSNDFTQAEPPVPTPTPAPATVSPTTIQPGAPEAAPNVPEALPTTPADDSGLAQTGADGTAAILLSGFFLLSGAGILVARRRR